MTLPRDAQARVRAAPPEYRQALTDLWHSAQANTRPDGWMPVADTLRPLLDALEGKSGDEARSIMEGRMRSLRARTGYQTIGAVVAGDPELGRRFVDGSFRALRRIRLVRDGDISWHELNDLRKQAHLRVIQEAVGDFGEDITAKRYP